MIFGGLSEQEIKKITKLLELNNISFDVKEDEIIKETNQKSLQYDLRHLNSPSISTHILAIEISDTAFGQMNESLLKSLQDFGITNQTPEGFNESELQSVEELHGKMLEGNKRLIGFENLYLVIISAVVVLLIFTISFANNYFDTKKLSLSKSDIREIGSFTLRNDLRNKEDYYTSIEERKLKPEELRIIKLLSHRLGLSSLGDDFRSMLNDIPLDLEDRTRQFIQNFSFKKAFEEEIKMLTKDEIYNLGEIEESSIPTKIDKLSDMIDEDVEKSKHDEDFPKFSSSHYNRVKKIINYINEYESANLFYRNIILSASFIKSLSDEKDLSREQIEIMSLLRIKDFLKEEKPHVRKAVDISYYRLSEKDLDSYYTFLVKLGAKSSLRSYNLVFERVFYKFTDQIYNLQHHSHEH
jgi:hypothetical protein